MPEMETISLVTHQPMPELFKHVTQHSFKTHTILICGYEWQNTSLNSDDTLKP